MSDEERPLRPVRLHKFRSAFLCIAFTHGVACEERETELGCLRFVLRLGTMRSPGRLDDAIIRQVECAVQLSKIEKHYLEPGDLARLEFTEAFTKLSYQL